MLRLAPNEEAKVNNLFDDSWYDLSIELYEEYSDIISSIDALKYLEADNNLCLAIEEDKDMDILEALAIKELIAELEELSPAADSDVSKTSEVEVRMVSLRL